MKYIYIYIMLCATIMLTGCHRDRERLGPLDGLWYSENYVQVYVDAASFIPYWWPSANSIKIQFEGERYLRDRYTSAEFNALAEKYEDTYFNRPLLPSSHIAMANEFTSVSVVSDNDFNGITAGESLNGVIKICASSPLKYIQSGYTLDYDWWSGDIPEDYKAINWRTSSFGSHPVNKFLSELTPADLVLLDHRWMYLLFTETPVEKEHNFTITFNIGETRIENTVAATFD